MHILFYKQLFMLVFQNFREKMKQSSLKSLMMLLQLKRMTASHW